MDYVALMGTHSLGCLNEALGFAGCWTNSPSTLSNDYFVSLLNETCAAACASRATHAAARRERLTRLARLARLARRAAPRLAAPPYRLR